MSLQVWLPLTKDLKNQGLVDVTVTNTGATYDASGGKLGGCYNFDGTNDRIQISNLSNPASFSVCFWMKRNASTGTRQFMFTAWNGVTCELQTNGALYCNTSGGGACYSPTAPSVGTWTHIIYTFQDKKEGKLYINGQLIQTTATSNSAGWGTTTGNIGYYSTYFNGSINDFRIYDHVLSPMEVKQISQGLVLHYPLNREGWGQENLLVKSGVFTSTSGWANNQNVTLSTRNNELKAVINQTDSTPGIKATNTFNLTAGTYTASLLIKVENGNKNFVNYPFYINNGTALYSGAYTKKENRGDYVYEEATFTLTSNANNIVCYILTSSPANGETWYLKWIKLEKGSKATPWCPNSSDELATAMGLNKAIEYDCSGFCNNGTRTGTFTWSSDTSKYDVSQQYNGNTYIVLPITCSFSKDAVSVSVWGYESNWNVSTAERLVGAATNSSGWCIGDYGSENTLFAFYANGSFNVASGFKSLTPGWHHFVISFDGLNLIYYVDGQEYSKKVFSSKQSVTGNYNINMGRHYGGGYPFKGKMSDLRIYATALSADDVRALYENSAYIDNSGNTYAATYTEV